MTKQTFTFAAIVVVNAADAVTAFKYIQQHNEMLPDVVIHIKEQIKEAARAQSRGISLVPPASH